MSILGKVSVVNADASLLDGAAVILYRIVVSRAAPASVFLALYDAGKTFVWVHTLINLSL